MVLFYCMDVLFITCSAQKHLFNDFIVMIYRDINPQSSITSRIIESVT